MTRPTDPAPRSTVGRLRRLAVRLRRDTRGSVLIEFAFILPILVVTLLLGGVEFYRYFAFENRVTQASSMIADIIARSPNLTQAEIGALVANAPLLVETSLNTTTDTAVAIAQVPIDGATGTPNFDPGTNDPNTPQWWYLQEITPAEFDTEITPRLSTITNITDPILVVRLEACYQPLFAHFLTGTIRVTGVDIVVGRAGTTALADGNFADGGTNCTA